MATCVVKEPHAISVRAIGQRRSLVGHAGSVGAAEHRTADPTSSMKHEHVRITVSDATTPGVEHVPARQLRNGDWELLRSPLYATQVAAGDVVRILDSETGTFEIVTRGGNVCVQFYLHDRDADDAQATEKVARDITRDIASVGGRLDGQTPGLIAFSIPVRVGFPTIEQIFAAAVRRSPGAQWQYTNVYDPKTGVPLAWWETQRAPQQ